MTAGLAALDDRLGDRRMTTVIERFVRFHERMYSHRYTERTGEYAVQPASPPEGTASRRALKYRRASMRSTGANNGPSTLSAPVASTCAVIVKRVRPSLSGSRSYTATKGVLDSIVL